MPQSQPEQKPPAPITQLRSQLRGLRCSKRTTEQRPRAVGLSPGESACDGHKPVFRTEQKPAVIVAVTNHTVRMLPA